MPVQNAWGRSKSVIHSPDAGAPTSGTVDVYIPKQTAFAAASVRCYGISSPADRPAGPDSGASPRDFVAACGITSYVKDGERHSLRDDNPWESEAFLGDKDVEGVTFSFVLDSSSLPEDEFPSQAEADFAFQILGWGA
jgi:hypothetical protein